MKKKSTSQSAFFNPRAVIGLFVCLAGVLIAFFAFGVEPTAPQANQAQSASDDPRFQNSITRQELAGLYGPVVVAAFQPPACVAGSEMFNDVPADNPFCAWIEELSRRGITGGCGGGNYCPNDPVTRQQMAVFLVRATSPEDVHLVGQPGEPAFENGFTNHIPTDFQNTGFYKDPFGIVHLVGDMDAPGNGIAFTLPAGYRPDRHQRFAVQGNGDGNTATVRINENTGGVQFFATGVTTVTLNGITFRTSND
jgi:S-layer homology domain